MLTFYSAHLKTSLASPSDMSALPADVDWIDALTPSTDEIALVERWLKVSLPTKDELAEVETSSRMSVVGAAVFLSMPATVRNADGYPTTTPIGFVVFETVVATIRFEHLPSFEKLAKRIADEGGMLPGGPRRDGLDPGARRRPARRHARAGWRRTGWRLPARLLRRPRQCRAERSAPVEPRACRADADGREGGGPDFEGQARACSS